MIICPAHFVTLGPCLEIFPEMVYNRWVLSKWGRGERNVVVKWSLSQCTLSDKLFRSGLHFGKGYSWDAAEVTFYTIFHGIARGGGGNQSFWHWLLKSSQFCLNELSQCSLPWWIVSFPCTLPLFDTEQSHPPEPLSNCKSPLEASDLGWWMPSLWELEKRAALSDALLNLHKIDSLFLWGCTSVWRLKYVSSFVTALLAGRV